MLTQINRQHGQVHLITRNNERHLVLDQSLPVVRRYAGTHIDHVRILFGSEQIHMLAKDRGRLLRCSGIHREQEWYPQQSCHREIVAFPDEVRQAILLTPGCGGHSDAQGRVKVMFELAEIDIHFGLHITDTAR